MAERVTVQGAGNAWPAIAFEISLKLGEVVLFEHPDFAENPDGIRQRGGIEAVAKLHGEDKLVPATLSGNRKHHHSMRHV